MLRTMAKAFLLIALFSLLVGKSYCKRTIDRLEDPLAFWVSVSAYTFLGLLHMACNLHLCLANEIKPLHIY